MGNALPCLVAHGTALPAMKPSKRTYSLNLLMKAIHNMKKKRANSNIASRSAAAAEEEAGAGEVKQRQSVKVRSTRASPRRAAACHGRHGHGGAGGGGHRKGVVRVKVVLTKEEAARLLSLTVGGGKATAAQIVAEMKRMEARRAVATAAAAWRPALASIPEESW